MDDYWMNAGIFQNILKTGSSPLGSKWQQFGELMQKRVKKRRKKPVLFGDIRDLIGFYRRQVEEEQRQREEEHPIGPVNERRARAEALARGEVPVERGAGAFVGAPTGEVRHGIVIPRALRPAFRYAQDTLGMTGQQALEYARNAPTTGAPVGQLVPRGHFGPLPHGSGVRHHPG